MLGMLLFSVILWMTEAVDYAVSAVLIVALMAFLLGMAPDPAKPQAVLGTSAALGMALGGFANTALALVAAALFISAAMTITGLDKRIALLVLSKVGARTNRVLIGAILVGVVLAFLVPSTTARVACLVPIMMGIILAFGAERKSRLAGMLMIATAQTASIWNVGIKTAAAQNMVAIGFIEKTLKVTITWLDWFIAAAPWAVLMSIALYFIMMKMMPPESEEIAGGKEAIAKALADTGADENEREETAVHHAGAALPVGDGKGAASLRYLLDHHRRDRHHVPALGRRNGLEERAGQDPLGNDRAVRRRHQPGHRAAADQGRRLACRPDRAGHGLARCNRRLPCLRCCRCS